MREAGQNFAEKRSHILDYQLIYFQQRIGIVGIQY